MAQVNITHFSVINIGESRTFALRTREVVAKEVHGLEKSEIQPGSVSVLNLSINRQSSLSGADTEVQVLVSGNNWPVNSVGKPADAALAKVHFDNMAARIYDSLTREGRRSVYVWVTPFRVSGWAEGTQL